MKITDSFNPQAGVYIFQCIPNGKYYIGESLNIRDRMKSHKWGGDNWIL